MSEVKEIQEQLDEIQQQVNRLVKEIQEQLDGIQQRINRLVMEEQSDQPHKGQWVWGRNDNFLFYWERSDDCGGVFGYGFNFIAMKHGECPWNDRDTDWCIPDQITRPATDDEVEQALIEEAKRRGYPGCREYKDVDGNVWSGGCGKGFEYDPSADTLYLNYGRVYHKGQWAEIISGEEPITINGHEVDCSMGGVCKVKVGCEQVDPSVFRNLVDYADRYGISIYRKGEDITLQIDKIAERIDQCT